jgi:hypothetical protein
VVVVGLDAVDLGEDFVVEFGVAIEIERAANRALGEGERDRRAVSQLLGQGSDLVVEFFGRDHPVDEPEGKRLVGTHELSGHHHLRRGAERDEPRQVIARRHVAAGETDANEGRAQPDSLDRDAEVARDCQSKTAAHGVALEPCDHRDVEVRDAAHGIQVVIDDRLPLRGLALDHLRAVGASAEGPAFRGEDEYAILAPADCVQRLDQRVEHSEAERVHAVGLGQRDRRDAIFAFESQRCRHFFSIGRNA